MSKDREPRIILFRNVRSGFQDREVVEWGATVPAVMKIRPWEVKHLRVAARRIPREAVYRPKHGFSIPNDAWFRGDWAAAARAIIFSEQARACCYFDFDYLGLWAAHVAGAARHGTHFWLLLWLELWFRAFVDRTLAPADVLPRAAAA